MNRNIIHVLPYADGTTYKNGKTKLKWVVRTEEELDSERVDHSELGQDNETFNTVKKDWDTRAENLMNGLDQDNNNKHE